jgi:redox-sensitive bicupin YhaK (pirin superfamily)
VLSNHTEATVIIGEFEGLASPARRDSAHLLVELMLQPGSTVVSLNNAWEHGILGLNHGVSVNEEAIPIGHLGYLGPGQQQLTITTTEPARVMLLGGEMWPEPVLMWWNYVARTRSEIIEAHREWTNRTRESERFGSVASPLAAIDVDPPPWPVR